MNLDFSSQHCMRSTLLRLFKWQKKNLNLLSQQSTLVISVDLSGTIHGREMGTCRLVSAEPLLMVFINGDVIQRATNIAAYDGCHDGHQATG